MRLVKSDYLYLANDRDGLTMEGDAEQNNNYHYNNNKGWGNAANDEYGMLNSKLLVEHLLREKSYSMLSSSSHHSSASNDQSSSSLHIKVAGGKKKTTPPPRNRKRAAGKRRRISSSEATSEGQQSESIDVDKNPPNTKPKRKSQSSDDARTKSHTRSASLGGEKEEAIPLGQWVVILVIVLVMVYHHFNVGAKLSKLFRSSKTIGKKMRNGGGRKFHKGKKGRNANVKAKAVSRQQKPSSDVVLSEKSSEHFTETNGSKSNEAEGKEATQTPRKILMEGTTKQNNARHTSPTKKDKEKEGTTNEISKEKTGKKKKVSKPTSNNMTKSAVVETNKSSEVATTPKKDLPDVTKENQINKENKNETLIKSGKRKKLNKQKNGQKNGFKGQHTFESNVKNEKEPEETVPTKNYSTQARDEGAHHTAIDTNMSASATASVNNHVDVKTTASTPQDKNTENTTVSSEVSYNHATKENIDANQTQEMNTDKDIANDGEAVTSLHQPLQNKVERVEKATAKPKAKEEGAQEPVPDEVDNIDEGKEGEKTISLSAKTGAESDLTTVDEKLKDDEAFARMLQKKEEEMAMNGSNNYEEPTNKEECWEQVSSKKSKKGKNS